MKDIKWGIVVTVAVVVTFLPHLFHRQLHATVSVEKWGRQPIFLLTSLLQFLAYILLAFFYFLLLFLLLLCREILSETNDIVNNISWQAISSSPHFCRGLYCMKFVESFQFILFLVDEVQFSNGIFVFMHNFFHNSLLFLFICFWYCNFLLLLLLSCTTFYFWLLWSKVLPLFISQVIENFIYL